MRDFSSTTHGVELDLLELAQEVCAHCGRGSVQWINCICLTIA